MHAIITHKDEKGKNKKALKGQVHQGTQKNKSTEVGSDG